MDGYLPTTMLHEAPACKGQQIIFIHVYLQESVEYRFTNTYLCTSTTGILYISVSIDLSEGHTCSLNLSLFLLW